MTDLLSMERINALPHPLLARDLGTDVWWPVHDIDVETGLMRIDVYGLLQVKHFAECATLKDADGFNHDPETFYTDHIAPEGAGGQR